MTLAISSKSTDLLGIERLMLDGKRNDEDGERPPQAWLMLAAECGLYLRNVNIMAKMGALSVDHRMI